MTLCSSRVDHKFNLSFISQSLVRLSTCLEVGDSKASSMKRSPGVTRAARFLEPFGVASHQKLLFFPHKEVSVWTMLLQENGSLRAHKLRATLRGDASFNCTFCLFEPARGKMKTLDVGGRRRDALRSAQGSHFRCGPLKNGTLQRDRPRATLVLYCSCLEYNCGLWEGQGDPNLAFYWRKIF